MAKKKKLKKKRIIILIVIIIVTIILMISLSFLNKKDKVEIDSENVLENEEEKVISKLEPMNERARMINLW